MVSAESKKEKTAILDELANSYLLKDVLELEKVKSSKTLVDLLRLLAFQVGSEVSHTELAGHLKIDAKTVARYCDILEKAFVLYNVRGFSRNLRNEITKKSKYYFFDNGLHNPVISNFNGLDLRNDIGALWENFIVIERLKKRSYQNIYCNSYFWRHGRTANHLVEERKRNLFAYESNGAAKAQTPFAVERRISRFFV